MAPNEKSPPRLSPKLSSELTLQESREEVNASRLELDASRLELDASRLELDDAKILQRISTLLIRERKVETIYDDLLNAAMALMRSDMASLQVVNTERNELELLAWHGFHPSSATHWQHVPSGSETTCGAAMEDNQRMVIPDCDTWEWAPGSMDGYHYRLCGIRTVQSTPLIARDGRMVGVMSTHWRHVHQPGEREFSLFDVLARQTADVLDRAQSDEALRALLAERESLLKELHHRVKNNLQVVTSLLELQARKTHSQEALVHLSEARHRVASIAAIHEMLYQSKTLSRVELIEYTRKLSMHLLAFYETGDNIRLFVKGGGTSLDIERAVPYALLLNELVSNVCKHAFPSQAKGELRIAVDESDSLIHLEVSDTGIGLPDDARTQKSPTAGLGLVRMLAKQLGGTVEFAPPPGTTVTVTLPRQSPRGQ